MKKTLLSIMLFPLTLVACGTSPASHFYALSAIVPVNSEVQPLHQTDDLSISVGSVTLPDLVDRPQLVTQVTSNQVKVYETQRWANSLKQDIPRIMAQDIRFRLPSATVAAFPQYVVANPHYTVQVDIQRFESVLGSHAVLDALWTVTNNKSDKVLSGSRQITEPTHKKGFDALVAAHSRALAAVSTDIAQAIETDLIK